MSFFYTSERVGRGGKTFTMWKIRTLVDGSDKAHFAQGYTRFGHFLRKYKIDELPQLWNILKGDMSIVGPRPMEKRTLSVIPEEIKEKILSVKPGLSDLSSLYFFDEERLLQYSENKTEDYWTRIAPMKFVLQCFYVDNKSFSLDLWIIFATLKKILKEVLK